MWQIWVDTGGTFTDCLAKSPDGKVSRLKILSSSHLRGSIIRQLDSHTIAGKFNWNTEKDIFKGFQLKTLGSNVTVTIRDIDLKNGLIHLNGPIELDIEDREFEITSGEEVPVLAARVLTQTELTKAFPPLEMRLGSTRGTNALLERKGAKVIFITTKGFKDLITIGDQQRPNLFELNIKKPKPLYTEVIEVDERIDKDGRVITELTEAEIEKLANLVGQYSRKFSIAISFLNSYKNSSHELRIAEIVKNLGFEYVSSSASLSKSVKILPRAETTIANSYLLPIIDNYIKGIVNNIPNGQLKVMTSSGAVVNSNLFFPKDSLLSGPAGGIVGAASIGERTGENRLLTFDMGGTSTDVGIYNQSYDYTYETKVGDARIQSPCLSIETIAAGGGSICHFDGELLLVGPHSAGAIPGPSCYGAGGPLTITDLNLLSGKLVPTAFSIPISQGKAQGSLDEVINDLIAKKNKTYTREDLITSFLNIANEKMAEAIKKVSIQKGHNPSEYSLISYGGAGGQHACSLATLLNIKKILIPYDAGLLSAYGISQADIEHFSTKQVLKDFLSISEYIDDWWTDLWSEAKNKMVADGYDEKEILLKKRLMYLRFEGQESTIEIDVTEDINALSAFHEAYENLYGHWLENHAIEIESMRLIAAVKSDLNIESRINKNSYSPDPTNHQDSFSKGTWKSTPVYTWEDLTAGATIKGRSIIVSQNTTVYIEDGWELVIDEYNDAHIIQFEESEIMGSSSEEAGIELFKNRFIAVVEEMGALLQRTSFSVNVKERLDFSCTLLDKNAILIANAPHIPVHLGSMGICVRRVLDEISIREGDVIITNHPAFGGSHLPDITLISGVYFDHKLIGYVANRAHHSEVGGETPGSMPPNAQTLEQEGVIISPQYLIKQGEPKWNNISKLLSDAKFPTRSLAENIADLEGALASIRAGVQGLQQLCSLFGSNEVSKYMGLLRGYVADKLQAQIINFEDKSFSAKEKLDDGSLLKVKVSFKAGKISFDFTGSSEQHQGNLNATEAIVQSVVLYVLRLIVDMDLPLNEGLMEGVTIINPKSLLNPDFLGDMAPAVVGGNTEVSQRLTDTLLKALNMSACSQGTMNNLLFGNASFGYYETICGGTGAGNGFDGHDAVHQHMTNTRITDPEILELRYPVRLNRFEIRKGSGGDGKFKGGDGIKREFEMLDNLTVTVLTQHRVQAPYGMAGGSNGKVGTQYIIRNNGDIQTVKGIESINMRSGDKLIMKTPGGGGYAPN